MLLKLQSHSQLCRARDLLREIDHERRLSIRDIAREVRMSPFHFIRQFSSVFGVTPHQFRIQSRLDQAKLLLAAGHHSVTEVCLEVGFDSLGSFSDLFTRRIGSTPSAYHRGARRLVQIPGGFPQELFPGCLRLMTALPPDAFRNFREASTLPAPLECGKDIQCKSNSPASWSMIRTKP